MSTICPPIANDNRRRVYLTRSVVMGSPLWAARWACHASLVDFMRRRSNASRRRPRDLGTHPTGDGWIFSRGTARQVWHEVFFPYPMCTNWCASQGMGFPRPGAGFGVRL